MLGLASTLLAATATAAPQPPNVVVLLADDLGWADVGYHGSEIETPAIDRIAREGVRLERFYVAPICSPTRAALLTGRDPMELGIAYDQLHPWYNAGLPPDATTLADVFRAAGYRTGIVGKWHLGHTQAHQLPNAHGFDHFHGHLHTNTDYYEHRREGGHDLQRDGQSVFEPGVYLSHIQGREAARFIRERDPDRPFLLYVPFTAPHSPMQAPEATIEHYAHLPEARYRRVYAAMVHELDLAIAKILAALDQEGIGDDTLVLFCSDNGGFNAFGAVNKPLRGQKGQAFEGGIRVPAAIRWPARLPAGGALGGVMSVLDVLPTLASAAAIPLEADDRRDGRDRWAELAAGELAADHPPLYFVSEIPIPGLIQLGVIDGDWKLVQILRERPTSTEVRSMLFRIREDPHEERNLAERHPEQVERLGSMLARWRARHPMAGTRGTLVPHPGWVPPLDWAAAVQPASLLQPRWRNELPFSRALIEATAERGVLVDEATRKRLEREEEARGQSWSETRRD